jgi:hypothetical protein
MNEISLLLLLLLISIALSRNLQNFPKNNLKMYLIMSAMAGQPCAAQVQANFSLIRPKQLTLAQFGQQSRFAFASHAHC